MTTDIDNQLIGKYVLIHTVGGGVWAGILAEIDGADVIIKNARRMWKSYAACAPIEKVCLKAKSIQSMREELK